MELIIMTVPECQNSAIIITTILFEEPSSIIVTADLVRKYGNSVKALLVPQAEQSNFVMNNKSL